MNGESPAKTKKKVAFICVHNSCRSQVAEALGKKLAGDAVITMGCNVQCPSLPCSHREDWGLEDPTGKSDEEFRKTIAEIENRILQLKEALQ